MRQAQDKPNTKKIESLLASKREKERKKNVEQMLIVGIVLFCLSALYFVFSSSSEPRENRARMSKSQPSEQKTIDKAQPKSTGNSNK